MDASQAEIDRGRGWSWWVQKGGREKLPAEAIGKLLRYRDQLKEERDEARKVLVELYEQQECCRVDMNGATTVRLRNVSASLWTRWMKAIEEA